MNKSPEEILAMARRGQEVAVPTVIIEDPFVLEFLDLKQSPTALEFDLEQAIIDRIEEFLLEIGKGFCFVARQKRITLEEDHFYIDLVFYNRLLRVRPGGSQARAKLLAAAPGLGWSNGEHPGHLLFAGSHPSVASTGASPRFVPSSIST